MSNFRPTEERFPLLLYFVENDKEFSSTNKRFSSEKSRLQRINDGVVGVFSEWPNYFGTCWIGSILSGLFLFMLMLMIIANSSTKQFRIPRCAPNNELEINSVHLVHKCLEWNVNELKMLENIAETFSVYNIHIILLNETDCVKNNNKKRRKRFLRITKKKRNIKRNVDTSQFNLIMGTKRLLEILLHQKSNKTDDFNKKSVEIVEKPLKFDDILDKYPKIALKITTMEKFFNNTPLKLNYKLFNDDLQLFAVRVLQLWQSGGLSFDLYSNKVENYEKIVINSDELSNKNKTKPATVNPKDNIRTYLNHERFIYENLQQNVLTADDYGFHMESKTPCHAFFGEILMQLRVLHTNVSVKEILRRSLKTFCKHSIADRRHCNRM